MVQVINGPPSFGEQFGRGLGEGAGQALTGYIEKKNARDALLKENDEIYKATGFRLSSTDPKMREIELTQALKGKYEKEGEKERIDRIMQLRGSRNQPQNMNHMTPSPSQQGANAQVSQAIDQNQKQQISSDENEVENLFNLAEEYALLGEKDLAKTTSKRAESKLKQSEIKQSQENLLRKESPEFQRSQLLTEAQTKSDIDYNKGLEAQLLSANKRKQINAKLRNLADKGVTGKPYEKALERFGLINLTSEGRREFTSLGKEYFRELPDILGRQFSQFEFATIGQAFPSADYSVEANKAILDNFDEVDEMKIKEAELAKDLIKQNKGKIPENLQQKVNDRLLPYVYDNIEKIKQNTKKIVNAQYGILPGNILMFDSQGEPLSVADNEETKKRAFDGGAMMP